MELWNRAGQLAAQTPPGRNRYVDFLRAVSIAAVIYGHWTAMAPYVGAQGQLVASHMLAEAPWTRWLTWGIQVMPVFFLVGGFANGISWAAALRSGKPYAEWLDGRLRRLVGPVLEGTADRYSRISVHLFCDPPDAVAMDLNERGIGYHQEERRIRWHDGSHRRVQMLVTEADGSTVELALFTRKDLRQAPPCPVHGHPQRRAPVAEVESLLAGA